MAIEGIGMTVNFGDISLDLNKDISLIDNPTPYDEGLTLTATVKFEPEFMPLLPVTTPFIITYIEHRKKKRKKRPNGTMVKHSRRKVDKCKVKIAFNGVVESGDGENVTIRKV